MNKLPTFHCGALETFSGPAIGTLFDLINILLKARDMVIEGKTPTTAGDLLNIILQNAPYANLTYVRQALDLIIVHTLLQTNLAKSLNRQYQQRQRQYGQSRLW
ncbi:hypothetical protein [Rhizobium rhizogenes]|uniref:hypothetical protein n=1 Tax=Rhizobium rhizogenes TaxID=359 RepID=UPI0024BE49EF|nr:hypothetical protein [Rhizobium rhizogenes]MDJ1634564.1 hypothetical protein [Rhizobium rhizogenes]